MLDSKPTYSDLFSELGVLHMSQLTNRKPEWISCVWIYMIIANTLRTKEHGFSSISILNDNISEETLNIPFKCFNFINGIVVAWYSKF